MKNELVHLPGLTPAENHLLNSLLAQLRAKRSRNFKRDLYYRAKARLEANVRSGVIPEQYYRMGLVLGWCEKAVNLLARRTNLADLAWPGHDLAALGWSQLETGNDWSTEIHGALVESLVQGVSFLVTSTPAPADVAAGAPPAMVHAVSALTGTGLFNPRTRRLDAFVKVTEEKAGHVGELTFYLPGRQITAARHLSNQGPQGDWRILADNRHQLGVPVEPLVYRPRTGRRMGTSRITHPMMAIQDAGLRELIRLEGHMDVFSFPEFWMLGADPSIFDASEFAVMLGRIKGIPDDEDATTPRADVRQFAAANPTPHLANLNAQAKLFAREASLPDASLAITDLANPTSAEAYDAAQYELIHEAEGATRAWTEPIRRTAARLLHLANDGDIPDDTANLRPVWRNPRYLTRAAEADAGLKQLSAVPWLADTTVGLDLVGLTADQQAIALAERGDAQALELARDILATAPDPGIALDPQVAPIQDTTETS